MHFGDSIFIFLLALVLFGPKKLPEIGRTIGKLLAEFRRASNEFKFQIQEELRNMEDEERKKKLAEKQAEAKAKSPDALPAPDESTLIPSILPPSTGAQISTSAPYATPLTPPDPTPVSAAIEPSATEVLVQPAAPTSESAPAATELVSAPLLHAAGSPAHLDLSTHANGIHPVEPFESPLPSVVPGESLNHG